jgi:hypothetical protein
VLALCCCFTNISQDVTSFFIDWSSLANFCCGFLGFASYHRIFGLKHLFPVPRTKAHILNASIKKSRYKKWPVKAPAIFLFFSLFQFHSSTIKF